jgi:hypothetical protein
MISRFQFSSLSIAQGDASTANRISGLTRKPDVRRTSQNRRD